MHKNISPLTLVVSTHPTIPSADSGRYSTPSIECTAVCQARHNFRFERCRVGGWEFFTLARSQVIVNGLITAPCTFSLQLRL